MPGKNEIGIAAQTSMTVARFSTELGKIAISHWVQTLPEVLRTQNPAAFCSRFKAGCSKQSDHDLVRLAQNSSSASLVLISKLAPGTTLSETYLRTLSAKPTEALHRSAAKRIRTDTWKSCINSKHSRNNSIICCRSFSDFKERKVSSCRHISESRVTVKYDSNQGQDCR